MKQKNGFVISTTLYSIFGIMLISVFYILYLLSNNRYVLTSSIDDIKESLFNKTKKVYLELGYYGDLPDTIEKITDLELQKEINNRLKENGINKEVEINSVGQNYTETNTENNQFIDLEHILTANTPYINYKNTSYYTYGQTPYSDYFTGYRYADGDSSLEVQIPRDYQYGKCIYRYGEPDLTTSWWNFYAVNENKLLFIKNSMGELDGQESSSIYSLIGKEKVKQDEYLLDDFSEDNIVEIWSYNFVNGDFVLETSYKLSDVFPSISNPHVSTYTTDTFLSNTYGKDINKAYFKSNTGLKISRNNLKLEISVNIPILSKASFCVEGIALAHCDKAEWGNCCDFDNHSISILLEENLENYDTRSESAFGASFLIYGNCNNQYYFNTGLSSTNVRTEITKLLEDEGLSVKNTKDTLRIRESNFCNTSQQIQALKKDKMIGHVLQRTYNGNQTNTFNTPKDKQSFYIVWYIPKGTIYHHVDWNIKGKSDMYDENYYIGYANTGDIELEHITINDNLKLKEYDNSLFIDVSNKASSTITDNVSNYKTSTDNLIEEIIELIK